MADSERLPSGWTIDTYAAYNEAMRRMDALLRESEEKFHVERDRRYTEVNIEKEKALKIKETADLAALSLARDIQIYKDEKANELREQISSERGLYATKGDLAAAVDKIEATVKPIAEYMASDRGRDIGSTFSRTQTQWTFEKALTIIALIAGAIYFFVGRSRDPTPQPQPQVIYAPAPQAAPAQQTSTISTSQAPPR